MKYIVIGLGNLGRDIAENLSRIGNDVIGVDKNLDRVNMIKQVIAGAICMDTTDREALNALPLKEVDAIIVTYGKDFGVSVQTVAFIKSLGAEKIIVRAISQVHKTVIEAIGVSEVLTPEMDYSANYAAQSLLGGLFRQWYKVTETHHLFKITTPHVFVGQTLGDIKMDENFNMKLVAIERQSEGRNILGLKSVDTKVIDNWSSQTVVVANDLLLLFGKMEDLEKIAKL